MEVHREAHLDPPGGGGGEHLPGAGRPAAAPGPLRGVQAAGDGQRPLEGLEGVVFVQIEDGDPGLSLQHQLVPLPVSPDLAQGHPAVRHAAGQGTCLQQLPHVLGAGRLLHQLPQDLLLPLHLGLEGGAVQVLEEGDRAAAPHLGLGQQVQRHLHGAAVLPGGLAAQLGQLHRHAALAHLAQPRDLHDLGKGEVLPAGVQPAAGLLHQQLELHRPLEDQLAADEAALPAQGHGPAGGQLHRLPLSHVQPDLL